MEIKHREENDIESREMIEIEDSISLCLAFERMWGRGVNVSKVLFNFGFVFIFYFLLDREKWC